MTVALLLLLQLPVCPCTIRAERIATLGDIDGPGALSHYTGIARAPKGNWLVTHAGDLGRLHVFSPEGRFVRSVGRAGAGPGEYRYAALPAVGPGDSIWVFDQGLLRMSVLDTALRYVRSFPIPIPTAMNIRVLGDGRMIASSLINTEQWAGYPLHLIERDGSVSISFGMSNRILVVEDALPVGRVLERQLPRCGYDASIATNLPLDAKRPSGFGARTARPRLDICGVFEYYK